MCDRDVPPRARSRRPVVAALAAGAVAIAGVIGFAQGGSATSTPTSTSIPHVKDASSVTTPSADVTSATQPDEVTPATDEFLSRVDAAKAQSAELEAQKESLGRRVLTRQVDAQAQLRANTEAILDIDLDDYGEIEQDFLIRLANGGGVPSLGV